MRAEEHDAEPAGTGAPETDQHQTDEHETGTRSHPHRDAFRQQLHDHHPHLIDADEDRWRWRAKIRRDPRKLFFYRIAIAVAGLLLMIAAIITGPLPGPGGIPLFLLGLAVWASEFEWAQHLMLWFKGLFARLRRMPRWMKVIFWCLVVVCALCGIYVSLWRFGVPHWLPNAMQDVLHELPFLR